LPGTENEPISALILDTLRRFPKEGEKIKFNEAVIIVTEMQKNMIVKVKIKKLSK
jgi:Mg2+/Co2+ transporter CorB